MPENLYELLKRIINPFIFGNIIISLCTLALFLETYLQLGTTIKFDGLAFLVFFATLSLYNVHRLLGIIRIQKEDYGEITGWAANHRFTLFMLALIGAGGVAFFVFQTSLLIFGILFFLGAISLLYELPVIRHNQRFQRLRNLWIHKAFMITTVWTVATAVLPAVNAGISLLDYGVWLIVTERMLFIFLLALCFDARDIEFDTRDGLKTIPIRYGTAFTQTLYKIIIAAFVVVAIINYIILDSNYGIGIAMIISGCVSFIVISKTQQRKSDYYYIFLVDGMMVLQFFLVTIFSGIG
ncbi:MAG: hypothetical protein ABIO46_07590 [Chitinophagales bacterium]